MTTKTIGNITVSNNSWAATLTEEASSAIDSISYDGDNDVLNVLFNDNTKEYSYSVNNNAEGELYGEIVAVLANEEVFDAKTNSYVKPSIGGLFNLLLHTSNIVPLSAS
jgi:hypothetical protein